MATSNSISENAISFYASGGHAHDGSTSSLIKTDSYSIYDFNPSFVGDNPERRRAQVNNYNSFRQLVVNTINSTVLEPAGIVLQDNIINSRNIISGSITTTEIAANTITSNNIAANTITADNIAANTITSNNIAANTITSNNIAANTITSVQIASNTITANNISTGAITADKLTANLVLVNNVIRSNNFNGTVAANGIITSDGTTGWAITSAGDAVFDSSVIRGTLTAGAIYINASNYWNANGVVVMGNPGDVTPGFVYSPSTGLSVTGRVTATSGKIASFDIIGSTLYTGDSFVGWISLGPTATAYGSVPAGEVLVTTRDPADNHVVTSSMKGQELRIADADTPSYTTVVNKYGFYTNGTVASDSVQTDAVTYPYSANQIAFRWSGTALYAVIDGTTEYLLNTGSSAPAVTAVSPSVTPSVSPSVSPGGGCPTCPTHTEPCCPPAACGYDEKAGHYCV